MLCIVDVAVHYTHQHLLCIVDVVVFTTHINTCYVLLMLLLLTVPMCTTMYGLLQPRFRTWIVQENTLADIFDLLRPPIDIVIVDQGQDSTNQIAELSPSHSLLYEPSITINKVWF